MKRFGPILLCCLLLGIASEAGVYATAIDLERIQTQLSENRLGDAEAGLRRLLETTEHPVARNLLGVVLSRQGRFQQAEQEFSRAVELAPEMASARQYLARIYLQQKRADQAVQQLRAAAVLGPLERDLAMQLAALENSAGRSEAARRQLVSVVDRYDSVQALLRLATMEIEAQRLEAAREYLTRALAIAPNSAEVAYRQARLLLELNSPLPAIVVLEPLVRVHPAVPEYIYFLGVARLQLGDVGGAIESLQAALPLQPRPARTLLALGLALNQRKRYDQARDALAESWRLEPGQVDVLAALAEAHEGLGEVDKAEELAHRSLEISQTHATAHLVIGLLRMKEQQYQAAVAALGASVATAPNSTRAHYQLSLAFARLGDLQQSQEHLATYRRLKAEMEERLKEFDRQTGLGGVELE